MDDQIIIEPARLEDVPQIVELKAEASIFLNSLGNNDNTSQNTSSPIRFNYRTIIDKMITDPSRFVFLARTDNCIAGMLWGGVSICNKRNKIKRMITIIKNIIKSSFFRGHNIQTNRTQNIAYIELAYVKKEHQNKGIGTQLLNKFINNIKGLEINDIYISVDMKNEIGKNFWSKNRFKETCLSMKLSINDYTNI